MVQQVLGEQLYQVDEYNLKYHHSRLKNQPSYSYVYYDPHAYNNVPSSSTTFMELCLNFENLYEEDEAGMEENIPSGNCEHRDYIALFWSKKAVDKAADKEEKYTPTEEHQKEH